jgi:glucose-6-phosphate isomerase
MLSKINPTQTAAWKSLQRQVALQKDETLTDIFQKDPDRFNTYHIEFENILVDFSKTHIQTQNQTELLNLCRETNLK